MTKKDAPTKAPIKEVRRRFTYVGKKDVARRMALATWPGKDGTAHRAYYDAYQLHFFERFKDHPAHRSQSMDDLKRDFPEMHEELTTGHAREVARRESEIQAIEAEIGALSTVGSSRPGYYSSPEWTAYHDAVTALREKQAALRAQHAANPTTYEKWEQSARAVLDAWCEAHKDEMQEDLEEWCTRNDP